MRWKIEGTAEAGVVRMHMLVTSEIPRAGYEDCFANVSATTVIILHFIKSRLRLLSLFRPTIILITFF